MRKSFPVKNPLSQQIRKTIIYLLITLTIMIIGLGAFFILEIGNSGQKGYMLKQLQLESEKLRLENEDLNSKLTKILSLPNFENNPELKDMLQPEIKTYVKPSNN